MEKQKSKRESYGEIESEHPGFLRCQDMYYVGTFKTIGKVYTQTYIDSYCRVADVKLYREKTPITSADMLNDKVLPFYFKEEIPIMKILTDRGTEYKETLENHAYELFLSVEGITHSTTKAYSPQTNGICERFHKTMKNEFFDIAMRKKIYRELTDLQRDLDEWLKYYNFDRPHSGKYCYGKTPMQTFANSKKIAQDKNNEISYKKSAIGDDTLATAKLSNFNPL